MDYRVQIKEPPFRFYKIAKQEMWLDKKRTEFGPWLNSVIGKEDTDWKLHVSLRGLIFLYFLREDKLCLFILKYGDKIE